MSSYIDKITESIRKEAYRLGFEACGFAKVHRLEKEERNLEKWLSENRHGSMNWMENHFDKRVDPSKLIPNAKTVISVFCSYHQPEIMKSNLQEKDKPVISKYALGDDYHVVIKEKLYELYHFSESVIGKIHGRAFVDSAPVLDRAWAVHAGLGWVGKNSNILNKTYGSYFFLGELIIDAVLSYDSPATDHCGTCTRCIDACPTQAIYEPYKVDGSRCISYLTIELKDEIPFEFHKKIENWVFGCDICQDVCPWNNKAPATKESKFYNRAKALDQELAFWNELNLDQYRELFKNSAVKRTTFEGLKRNIAVVSANLEYLDKEKT